MLAISIIVIIAVSIVIAAASASGLSFYRSTGTSGHHGQRSRQGARLRKYISDHKWGMGIVLIKENACWTCSNPLDPTLTPWKSVDTQDLDPNVIGLSDRQISEDINENKEKKKREK